jgi:hypothetical protein
MGCGLAQARRQRFAKSDDGENLRDGTRQTAAHGGLQAGGYVSAKPVRTLTMVEFNSAPNTKIEAQT